MIVYKKTIPYHASSFYKNKVACFPPSNSLNAAVTSCLQPAHAVWGKRFTTKGKYVRMFLCNLMSLASCFPLVRPRLLGWLLCPLELQFPSYCFGESRQLRWDLPQLSCKTSLCDRWPFSQKVMPVNPAACSPSFTMKSGTKLNKLGKPLKLIWREYFLALAWGWVTPIFERVTARITLIFLLITLLCLYCYWVQSFRLAHKMQKAKR